MKLASIATAAVLALTASPALAALEHQDVKDVARAVVLPVELKDPIVAYGVGLVPLYSHAAAAYVGTSKLSWNPPGDLQQAAWLQVGGDVGLTVASALLGAYAGNTADAGAKTALQAGSILTLVAVPAIHYFIYAPFWGDRAVEFNKKRLAEAGFPEGQREGEAP